MSIAMHSSFRILAVAIIAAAAVLCAGCADISEDAYERIEIGMHIDSVRSIMGTDGQVEEVRGTSISAAGVRGSTPSNYRDEIHTWKSGHRSIVVHTRDGVVTQKFKIGF
jgi:hypothetical protein